MKSFPFPVAVAAVLLLYGCAGTPVPAEVGLRKDGTVPAAAPPPKSPNCVSSYVDPDSDPEHGALPIPRGAFDPDEARAAVRSIIEGEERTEILADVPGYLHAAAYSRLWKFPDDVEFWFPGEEPVIHFRSAARLGYGDMGVNRSRMERIREAYGAVSR